MSRFRRYRPSGSMLVALLALVMATTGSAVAATLITSKQIKNGTIQTADISKKAQKTLKGKTGATGPIGAAGAAGTPGAKGDKGDKGDAGANGTNGTNGAPGTARAYALSNGGGTMNAAKSKNVVGITKVATGAYCVQLDPSIDATTVEGVVAPDYSTTSTATLTYIRSSDADCGAGSNSIDVKVVRVAEAGTPTAQNAAETEIAADGGFFLIVP
jgi:hypothetical protein